MRSAKSQFHGNKGDAKSAAFPSAASTNGGQPTIAEGDRKSWVVYFPVCPKCGQRMLREGDGWKCLEPQRKYKFFRGCGGTDTSGEWRVEFFPTVPTIDRNGRERLNILTTETWPTQEAACTRVEKLRWHFRGFVMRRGLGNLAQAGTM